MANTANMVTLRGRIEHGLTLDLADEAMITLELPDIVIDTDDPAIRIPKTMQIRASSLEAGVQVPATDDVRCNPPQWRYLLTENWPGGRRSHPILLPSDVPVIEYSSLATATESPVALPKIVKTVNDVGPDEAGNIQLYIPTGEGDGGAPTGAAGGVLAGSYPNPSFAEDMATQQELNGVRDSAARPLGPWVAGVYYLRNDIVLFRRPTDPAGTNTVYRCHTNHLSSGTTLDWSKWDEWGMTTARGDLRYLVRPWAPNTQFIQYQLALRTDGVLIMCSTAHTSGSVYDATKWTVLGGTSGTSPAPTPEAGTLIEPAVSAATKGHYTAMADDIGKIIEPNQSSYVWKPPASPGDVTVVVPPTIGISPETSLALPLGSIFKVRWNSELPPTVISKGGLTMRGPAGKVWQPDGKYNVLWLHKVGPTEWAVSGPMPDLVKKPISATIDFGTPRRTIDNINLFGYCVTGFTDYVRRTSDGAILQDLPGDIRNNPKVKADALALQAGMYRVALRWNSTFNMPYNGASSGRNTSLGGGEWVEAIKAVLPAGGRIVGVISGPGESDSEMNFSESDVSNIVQYSIAHNWGIKDWVIGNEPELGNFGEKHKFDVDNNDTHSGVVYGKLFARMGKIIKQIDPTAKLWGPAASSFGGRVKADPAQAPVADAGQLKQFFNDFVRQSYGGVTVASLLDVLCWHNYLSGTSGDAVGTQALMQKTWTPLDNVGTTGAQPSAKQFAINELGVTKANQLEYSVNEFNMFYQPANGWRGQFVAKASPNDLWFDDRQYAAEQTVIVAAAYRSLTRTTNAHLMYFGDIVGSLGIWTRTDGVPPALGDWIGGTRKFLPSGFPGATRMGAYNGIGMWTGMSLFRRFGKNIVLSPSDYSDLHKENFISTALPHLEFAAASDNGGDIMIINKDQFDHYEIDLTLTGKTTQAVHVWQTDRNDPQQPPKRVATGNIVAGKLLVDSPPMTVTRVVITP